MIHLQEYREEYRHRTGTVGEVTEIGVCHQLGGMNWFSGSSESRGVYLSIRTVTLDGTGGMSFVLGAGSKALLRPLGRRSAKAVREVTEVVDPLVPEILALYASGDKRAAFLKARDLIQAAPAA